MNKIAIVLACVATLCSLSTQPAAASSESTVTVSPAITEWLLAPGATETKILRVINNSNAPIPIQVAIESITLEEEISHEDRQKFDASAWFTVDTPQFILHPHEVRETKLTAQLPQHAEPGGHYATIYFQQLLPVTNNQQSKVGGQVGALALVTTKGEVKKQLHIEAVHTAESTHGAIALSVDIRNTGNIHVLPAGRFVIRDWRGKMVKELTLPTGIVFPGTTRTYTVQWQSPPFAGYFGVTAEIQYGEQHTKLPDATKILWIIPGGWLVFLIIGATIAWLLVFRIRTRWIQAIQTLFRG